jgi:lipopolysaccharide transport system ATP-binding protein
MAAVKSLCQRGIILENGAVKFEGKINDVLSVYEEANNHNVVMEYIGNKVIKKAILNENLQILKYKSKFKLDVYFESNDFIKNLMLGIVIKDLNDTEIIGINNKHYLFDRINNDDTIKGKISLIINEFSILPGKYKLDIFLGDSINDIEIVRDAIIFNVTESFENEVLNRLDFRLNKIFHENVYWEFLNT